MCLLFENTFSQTLLTPNGSFENGSPLPTQTEQSVSWNSYATVGNCDDWEANTTGNTSDWYTTLNYTDAMKGICPSDGGTAQSIIYGTPKITSAPHGNIYAGCGNHETMIYHLISDTEKDGMVKLSFWFNLRGPIGAPNAVTNAYLGKILCKHILPLGNRNNIVVDTETLGSGIYFCNLVIGDKSIAVKKLIVIN